MAPKKKALTAEEFAEKLREVLPRTYEFCVSQIFTDRPNSNPPEARISKRSRGTVIEHFLSAETFDDLLAAFHEAFPLLDTALDLRDHDLPRSYVVLPE